MPLLKAKSESVSSIEFHCFVLLITAGILFGLGVLMVFNTSSAEALSSTMKKSTHIALYSHLTSAFIGLTLSVFVWAIGYKTLVRLSPYFFLMLLFCLVLVFVPKIGISVNGAHRWLRIGGYTVQPSEFVKLVLPLFYLYLLPKVEHDIKKLFLMFILLGLPLSLIIIEPANATTLIIGLTISALFLVSRIPFRFWLIPMVVVGCVGGVIAINMPHVKKRIAAFKNPEEDIRGKGHQPYQAKIAAGSGGVLGKGLGKSVQKLHYLPEAQNDYIAAIYAEEFGFIGIFLLIVLYMSLAYLGFSIALVAEDIMGIYLATAFSFLIAIQAFLNLAVVSGLVPSTGLNLPFFSQGGSSLITNMLAVSIICNIGWEAKKNRKQV